MEQRKNSINPDQQIDNTPDINQTEKNKGFWGKFVNFIAMGGFLLIVIVLVIIAITIDILF
jgi:hypothetical protein